MADYFARRNFFWCQILHIYGNFDYLFFNALLCRELIVLQEEISKLENEQNHYIGQVRFQSVTVRCYDICFDCLHELGRLGLTDSVRI